MLIGIISQQNLSLLTLYSIFSFLSCQIMGQVVWNDYPDIQSAQVTVYSGTQLIVDLTPSVSFSRPFTFSGAITPAAASLGINGFEMPQTHDFSLMMNKSISGSTLSFIIQVADQSAFYKLTINYLVMFNNHAVYRIIDAEYYCSTLTTGVGYRSQYHIIRPNATSVAFFNTTDIETAFVLEGFRLINTQGSYTFLGVTVNLPTPSVINTTFFTFEQNQISYLKYSIICFKRSLAYVDMKEIFEIGYANFTFNMTLINLFIDSIDTRYTSAPNRMFFGLRQFNFTYQSDKIFLFDVNSYSSLLTNYQFTEDSLVRIRLSFLFFVERTCSGATYFYKNLSSSSYDQCYATCGFNDRPVLDGPKRLCLACHYTCLTCTGVSSTDCSSCSSQNNRTLSGTSCPCTVGFVDEGIESCTPCWKKITGCHACTSTTSCTSCRTGFIGTTSCVCPSGLVVSGFCSSIYGCTAISNITGIPLCTACDETLLLILAANFTCICQGGTTTLLNGICKMNCGDGYVLTTEGCDDGNTVSGDGCTSTCKVEEDWLCIGIGTTTSVCKISVTPNLQYIGIQRMTTKNQATMYFNLTPIYPQYKMIDYTGLLDSNLINNGFEISFDTTYHLLMATFNYNEDIEGTEQSFILYLNSTKYFWNPSDWAVFELTGVNCELTYDQALWMNSALKYVYLACIFIAFGIFIASIFYQKWIGLELIQTYQTVFFLSTLNLQYPFEFTGIYQTFKYSNGYDDLIANPYPKIYTLSDQLIALSFEKQFLSNYNLMYFIVLALLIGMIVIGLLKRRYRMQLQEHISKKIGDKIKKLQRIYSIVFGRIFIMLVLFSMNKVIFCFCVQLSSERTYIENLPDQLNVIFAMIAFIMVFSVISFILYWYLLLPAGHNQEQQFMSLRFSNMSEYYPVLYLAYQAILILSIAIGYALTLTIYVVLIIQIVYFFLIIYLRPYNTLRQLNKFLHNATIAFNQFTCIVISYVVIRWNSIIGTPYQQTSNPQLTTYCFILLILLLLCCVLAILRIAIFNKDVSLNCCKKEKEEFTDRDYDQMKKMMINEGAQKLKDGGDIPAQTMRKINDREQDYIRKQTNNEEMLVNQSGLDRFLNAEHVHWVKNSSLIPENRPKPAKAKRTNSTKKAEMIKSPLQKFIEMKKIQQQQNSSRFNP